MNHTKLKSIRSAVKVEFYIDIEFHDISENETADSLIAEMTLEHLLACVDKTQEASRVWNFEVIKKPDRID